MEIKAMWGELWRTLQQRLHGGSGAVETDPEILLAKAQAEWRQLHSENRDRAVKALTQRNQLQQMLADQERKVLRLASDASDAQASGDTELAGRFLSDKARGEQALVVLRDNFAMAEQAAEQVKAAIRSEEEKIRQRTAHAVALQVQWKLIKIEQAISASIAQINAGVAGYRLTPEQIRERHQRNQEYVAEAITHKNQLQQMVDGIEVQVANLREKADTARRRGEDAVECELLRRMEQYEASLAQARGTLQYAAAITERARALVQEESARTRGLPEGSGSDFSEIEPMPTILPRPPKDFAADRDELPLLLLMVVSAGAACALFFWMIFRGI